MFGIGFLQKKRKGWPADASSYDENVERHCKSGCRREVAHKHCVYEACSFVGYWYRDLDKIDKLIRWISGLLPDSQKGGWEVPEYKELNLVEDTAS